MMMLIHWCDGGWILEQPASSLMHGHPAVAAALLRCQYFKINAFLGAYRHWTWELCSFYSNRLLDCIGSCMRDSSINLCVLLYVLRLSESLPASHGLHEECEALGRWTLSALHPPAQEAVRGSSCASWPPQDC